MKGLFIYTLSMSIMYGSYSQDFVIKNNGDTIKGFIKANMFEHQRYGSIKMILENGNKLKFEPTDIVGYRQADDVFESVNICEKGVCLKFLRLLIDGHCKLYDYKYSTPMYSGGQYFSSVQSTYYLKKTNEPVHEYSYVRLMKGIDLYFVDHGPLTFDIKMKKYKKRDIRSIVKRYNKEWVSFQ